MSDQIPNAVSSDMLRGLLSKGAPESSVMPRIDFGGKCGGPCDFQFAISQMVARSIEGVNLVQIMVAALHLMTEVQIHMDEQLRLIENGDPKLEAMPEDVRKEVLREMRRQCAAINSCTTHMEAVLNALTPPACAIRLGELLRDGDLQPISDRDTVYSHLLISKQVIDSLELDRDSITKYITSEPS